MYWPTSSGFADCGGVQSSGKILGQPHTVTEALADEIRQAINALPVAHRVEPQDKEVVKAGKQGKYLYAFKTGTLYRVSLR